MTRERHRRNMIIIALCLVLVLMGVGYAAYSTSLNINGTANISNSWCVGFDQTKTNTYTTQAGLTGGTTPTGTMTYTGTACETNYKPSVSLSTNFYQPGDQVEYTLTIKNKSSVTAAIKSILVDSESVTSNTTITKNNIKYIINMPETTTLTSNGETTMTVTAQFQNDTPIDTGYTGETQTLTVAINTEQDDGSGGMIVTKPPFTGTVYAWNTTEVIVGTSTINDLISTKTTQPYYTSAAEVMSASGYTFFNKYTVVEDTIIEGYSCQTFGITGFEPLCLKRSGDGSTYGTDTNGNKGILKILSTNETFTGNNPAGTCVFDNNDSSYCLVNDLNLWLTTYTNGSVMANNVDTGVRCSVITPGKAICSGKW